MRSTSQTGGGHGGVGPSVTFGAVAGEDGRASVLCRMSLVFGSMTTRSSLLDWASGSATPTPSRPVESFASPSERAPGVLGVHVGEALAGLVDVDQKNGDELPFGAWRVGRWEGAGQSPLLTRASCGSCDPSLIPSRYRHLAPANAMFRHHQRYFCGLDHRYL